MHVRNLSVLIFFNIEKKICKKLHDKENHNQAIPWYKVQSKVTYDVEPRLLKLGEQYHMKSRWHLFCFPFQYQNPMMIN